MYALSTPVGFLAFLLAIAVVGILIFLGWNEFVCPAWPSKTAGPDADKVLPHKISYWQALAGTGLVFVVSGVWRGLMDVKVKGARTHTVLSALRAGVAPDILK